MKTLLTLVLLATTSIASATSIQHGTGLSKGDIVLHGGTGTILDVTPICSRRPGEMSCMAYGSSVMVSVGLGGCADRLGGYHSSFRIKNGKGILTFASTVTATEASRTIRCIRMPTAEVKITVPFEGQIEIENLAFNSGH